MSLHLIQNSRALAQMNFSRIAQSLTQRNALKIYIRLEATSTKQLDYTNDYIHKSPVPTMIFQNSMPPLSLPSLEDSLKRYLDAVEPVCDQEEFNSYKKIVTAFGESEEAKLLQKKLEDYRESIKNINSFIGSAWSEMYLRDRRPAPINTTPFIALNSDPIADKNEQIARAALILHCSARIAHSLEDNVLYPDVYHMDSKKSDTDRFWNLLRFIPKSIAYYYGYFCNAYALDMIQYKNLFFSTRLPRRGIDEIAGFAQERPSHAVIVYKENYYKINIFNEKRGITKVDEIYKQIKWILENHKNENVGIPISCLTAMDRDKWAIERMRLEEIGVNSNSLQTIDRGMIVLTLTDDVIPENDKATYDFFLGRGNGRWWDKSVCVVIPKSGQTSVYFEHSWGDGISVLRFVNELYSGVNNTPMKALKIEENRSNYNESKSNGEMNNLFENPQKLEFVLDDKQKQVIFEAQKEYLENCKKVDIQISRGICKINSEKVKAYKLSMDGLMQLAIQMGYHLHSGGKSVGTYESCSTAGFRYGRTDIVRSNTVDTREVSKTLYGDDLKKRYNLESKIDCQKIFDLILKANKTHSKLAKNGVLGQGFDRHLFMIRKFGLEQVGNDVSKLPAIFTAGGIYDRLNYYIISTSTLQSPSIHSGGFGPVVSDGFGVGYGNFSGALALHITSFDSEKCKSFVNSINQAWMDICKIIETIDMPDGC